MSSQQRLPDEGRAGKARVTLSSLARHLGLSTTTVSVVLNDSPAAESIPTATRQRILAAAAEMQYRPNYMARSLRGSRSMSVGILATESSEGYYTLVLSGIEQALTAANYFYFTALHYGRQELVDGYATMLGERSVDGLLLVSTPPPSQIDRPVVSVSGRTPREGVTNIVLDHRRAAQLALGCLKELGHRRIAFLQGWSFNIDTDARWQAILEVAREMEIGIDAELCTTLNLHSWSPQTGYEPVEELLSRTREFTALVCFNDIAAIGAIRALHDAGLSVPGDVSVMGFDDITGAAFTIPSLTTIRQPLVEMGSLAAQTLLERIAAPGGLVAAEIVVQPTLVMRESVGVARASRRTGRP